jgi:hypothetical protein
MKKGIQLLSMDAKLMDSLMMNYVRIVTITEFITMTMMHTFVRNAIFGWKMLVMTRHVIIVEKDRQNHL